MVLLRSFSRFGNRFFTGHGFCIPHPQKVAKGGEDAMFHSRKALAVADGVGGWSRVGVDPANYSRNLVHELESSLPSDDGEIENPVAYLRKAYDATAAARIIGSSTCCIVTLQDGKVKNNLFTNVQAPSSRHPNDDRTPAEYQRLSRDFTPGKTSLFRVPSQTGSASKKGASSSLSADSTTTASPSSDSGSSSLSDSDSEAETDGSSSSSSVATLTITNLGDSGALVFRPSTGQVIFRTEEQCHDFNFPKQLGYQSDDMPEHADVTQVEVQVGDIVLCATDGLYDNVFDEDIVELLKKQEISLQEKSITLAKTAFTYSLNPNYLSPFAQREKEWLDKRAGSNNRIVKRRGVVLGGKSDDISIVLAEIE